MKVSKRGQVTIPKTIRERTGIDVGTEVDFQEDKGRIVIAKASRNNRFEPWIGYLKHLADSDVQVKKMRGHAMNSHKS